MGVARPGRQILLTALGVALVLASGGSLALALGLTGALTWTAGHGHGLADLVRDPGNAARHYLREATPGSVLVDVGEFALTFVPGAVLGRLGGPPLRWLLRSAPGKLVDRLMAWRQSWRGVESGAFERLVPGGGLAAHEAAGGHGIADAIRGGTLRRSRRAVLANSIRGEMTFHRWSSLSRPRIAPCLLPPVIPGSPGAPLARFASDSRICQRTFDGRLDYQRRIWWAASGSLKRVRRRGTPNSARTCSLAGEIEELLATTPEPDLPDVLADVLDSGYLPGDGAETAAWLRKIAAWASRAARGQG